ncbi:MAG: hypothetical protein LBI10_11890, partial [Deltaproteobacteria bacterium]|nr:hypothetical protein [Deltaproteobacteria bacterium]
MSYRETRLDSQDQSRAVAVIGLSALFPGPPGLAGFWRSLKGGFDAITDIPLDRFNPSDYFDPDPKALDRMYCRRGAFLSPTPFEPLKFGIAPRDLETIDSAQLLGLVVADAALTDAGYPADQGNHLRTAVVMGVTGGLEMLGHMSARAAFPKVKKSLERANLSPDLIERILDNYSQEFAPWRESSFPGLLGNVVSGRIANRLNLGGPNMIVDAACASSLAAVGQALAQLWSGRADLVLTGGIDTFTDPFMFTCFCKTPALSPTEECRPFSAAADGALLGEGLGALVLKRLPDALKDQDRIYAIIRGLGASSDGRGTSIFSPSAKGQLRAMEAAYQEASVSPATVELIEGHGTGTVAGDAAELSALIELFSAQKPPRFLTPATRALGSVKSQIGHAKAAAGAAGLIKAILALYHKVLPPSIKVAASPAKPLTDPNCPLYLNDKARPWLANSQSKRRAATSAFGFGGANFHCVLEEGPLPKPLDEMGESLITLSGPNLKALAAQIEPLTLALDQPSLDALARDLFGRFQPEDPYRLVLAGSYAEVISGLSEATRLLADVDQGLTPQWPSALNFAAKSEPKTLRLVATPKAFTPNQGLDLALAFPAFLNVLDLANQLSKWPLDALLFPPNLLPAPNNLALLSANPRLALKLGTVLALAQGAVWASLGLPIESAEGFGAGVLVAAHLAGALTLKDAITLALSLEVPPGLTEPDALTESDSALTEPKSAALTEPKSATQTKSETALTESKSAALTEPGTTILAES